MYIKEMHEYYWSGSQSDPLTGFFFFFFGHVESSGSNTGESV